MTAEWGGHSWGQQVSPVWELTSDGSWIAETVAIGNEGSQVFTEFGSLQNSVMLFSAFDVNPPSPAWSDEGVVYNFARHVASASDADVHVSLHQEFEAGSTSIRRAVLRCYTSSSDAMDWSYELPVSIPGHTHSDLRVSAGGERIITEVYDSYQGRTHISTFDSNAGQPMAAQWLQTMGAVHAFALSADGTVAAVASDMSLLVLDVDTLAVKFTKYFIGTPNYGALSISGNGDVVVYGSYMKALVFEASGPDAYVEMPSIALTQGRYCNEIGISRDGTTLVMGLNTFDNLARAEVLAMDFATRQVVNEYEIAGVGGYQNSVCGIGVARDGSRFVVGLWGDQGQTVPEVLMFGRGSHEPIFEIDLPGSVNALDLSPEGDRVAIASKGTHANVLGGGGAIWLFEARNRDFDLRGVPSVGDTVTFEQQLGPNSFGRVLYSPMLSANPRVFAGVGTLLLDETQLSVLPGIALADGTGAAFTPHWIPNDSALIGTTVFYQGLGLRPRKLSEDMVRMTILP
jgi:hypothetical protein